MQKKTESALPIELPAPTFSPLYFNVVNCQSVSEGVRLTRPAVPGIRKGDRVSVWISGQDENGNTVDPFEFTMLVIDPTQPDIIYVPLDLLTAITAGKMSAFYAVSQDGFDTRSPKQDVEVYLRLPDGGTCTVPVEVKKALKV